MVTVTAGAVKVDVCVCVCNSVCVTRFTTVLAGSVCVWVRIFVTVLAGRV